MKKIALIITIAGIIGLSSCSKEYVCTYTSNGETAKVTLSDDNVVSCDEDGECETTTYAVIAEDTPSVTDKESAKDFLEDFGYTCK